MKFLFLEPLMPHRLSYPGNIPPEFHDALLYDSGPCLMARQGRGGKNIIDKF
ncbi:MAG: hypothetical protein ACLFPI_09180 [Desulfobacterales bacterium]